MKKVSIFFLCLLLTVSCCGCFDQTTSQSQPASHLVNEITIWRESDHVTHHYSDQASMGKILNYIRRLNPYGKAPQNFHQLSGVSYQITIHFSDGTQRVYEQKAQRFFYDADCRWKQIDPEAAAELPMLFDTLHSTTQKDTAVPASQNSSVLFYF